MFHTHVTVVCPNIYTMNIMLSSLLGFLVRIFYIWHVVSNGGWSWVFQVCTACVKRMAALRRAAHEQVGLHDNPYLLFPLRLRHQHQRIVSMNYL